MKILVIGSGGREHALADAFIRCSAVETVYVAPGNDGIAASHEQVEAVAIAVDDIEGLLAFAQEQAVDWTFVGSEAPLALGVVDTFRQHGLTIIGPTKQAAQLETSKQFAKEVMAEAGVLTAGYRTFDADQLAEAQAYVRQLMPPIVIKENGLAAGKGVSILESHSEAERILADVLGKAENHVIIEDYLEGPEFSHFSLVSGKQVIPLGVSRDYKRALDDNQGLNTGGMGAVTPITAYDEELSQQIVDEIVTPVVHEMVRRGQPYTGILYTGVMQTEEGLAVIEFNARFGDPETQVLLPSLTTDFVSILEAHLSGEEIVVERDEQVRVGVVLAAKGYPESYKKDFNLNLPPLPDELMIHWAGVKEVANQWQANGGRIAMISARGKTVADARQQIDRYMETINNNQLHYRRDIAQELIEDEQ